MRTAIEAISRAFEAAAALRENAVRRLHLTLVPPEDFKQVAAGTFEPEKRWRADRKHPVIPARVTRRLMGAGRIREPFATGALDMYLRMAGRPAHEIEYLLAPPVSSPARQPGLGSAPVGADRAMAKGGELQGSAR